jgi:hypothetical protein
MRRVLIAIALCACALSATSAPAQERRLKFEKTIPYQLDKTVSLQAQVGAARVNTVELSRPTGGGSVGESIAARIRGGGASDTQATIRAAFEVEQPEDADWHVTFTLEFTDRQGKLIDRATKTKDFEGEATTYNVDHAILEYALPFIHQVTVKLEAKLD